MAPSKHPYMFLFAGAAVVLLIILLTIYNLNTPASTSGPRVFISGGSIPIPAIAPTINPPPIIIDAPPAQTVPATTPKPSPTLPTVTAPTSSQSTTNTPVTSAPSPSQPLIPEPDNQLLQFVYSLVPNRVNVPVVKTRTATEQALFDYGNQAGLAIMTFENAHADMVDVLKIWFADRTDSSGAAGVNSLADALTETGTALANLSQVPLSAQSANTALASSLKDAGGKLRAVVLAGEDTDLALVAALRAYNAAADSFTQSYIALSTVFSVNNVTFSEGDLGSIFQFSAGGGL